MNRNTTSRSLYWTMKEWPVESQIGMAKWEILSRFGPAAGLWWRFMPGVEITVPWPTGVITVDHNHPKWDWSLGSTLQEGFSADPNDHYRPWMEEHVGRQGWDWNWRMGEIRDCGRVPTPGTGDTLVIKIRRGKSKYATIASLMWNR